MHDTSSELLKHKYNLSLSISVPGQSTEDLWCTKWYWDRFYLSISNLSCQDHSIYTPHTHFTHPLPILYNADKWHHQ